MSNFDEIIKEAASGLTSPDPSAWAAFGNDPDIEDEITGELSAEDKNALYFIVNDYLNKNKSHRELMGPEAEVYNRLTQIIPKLKS